MHICASLTFLQRKHIATKPLHSQPDQLRDVVERLLSIFCSDPLASTVPTMDLLATPGHNGSLGLPRSNHSHASPFDLPSGARNATKPAGARREGQMSTGSPVSRRKIHEQKLRGFDDSVS